MESALGRLWRAAGIEHAWKLSVAPDASEDMDAPVDLTAATDLALVEACLAGRRDAFDLIVQRNQRQVYQLCYRFVGNHEEASDLAQDVFLRAYRGLRGFKGNAALATWLYRIAVNVCLNRVSATAKAPKLATIDAADPADHRAERADTMLVRGERAAEVRAAIARLPNKQRAALILRVYHELPHEQIAGILGSSVGAVKANFCHALANLKKLLQARASSQS
jgi:RNA polymerase sigma-70 factor (ECF subfamily)